MLREGDELVISKLDSLGRSQVELINRLADLQEKGIQIRALDGLINTRGHESPLNTAGRREGTLEEDQRPQRKRTPCAAFEIRG